MTALLYGRNEMEDKHSPAYRAAERWRKKKKQEQERESAEGEEYF